MAGLPNPCDINEKCVKCRCIDGSSICCGLVLHSGDLSWFSKSINSLVICLEKKILFVSILSIGLKFGPKNYCEMEKRFLFCIKNFFRIWGGCLGHRKRFSIVCGRIYAGLLGCMQQFFSTIRFWRIRMLPCKVFRYLSGWKFRFADVTEIPGQMYRFTCKIKEKKIFFFIRR